MVTCKLMGYIGNQCFQIAAVIGFATTYSMDYSVPGQTISPTVWPTYFPHLATFYPQLNLNTAIHKETTHAYQAIPYYPNVCLEGYFQSEKYFAHCREEVITKLNLPWYSEGGLVSIHVRRGDYLNYPTKHPTISNEYICNAIKYLNHKGFNKFLVFSDDMNWCKSNINSAIYPDSTFDYSIGKNAIEDMSLMSCCRHNIISNSTFSLWSYFFNRHPDKICVAPRQWFGPDYAHLDTKDIYPENCVIL